MSKILMPFLFAIVFPAMVRAQTTLESCRSAARKNYPQIVKLGLIRKSSEYSISNARRNYLPRFSVSSQASWQNRVSGFPEEIEQLYAQTGLHIDGFNKDQYKMAVQAEQNIWDGGESSSQKKRAKTESEVKRMGVEVELYSLNDRIDNLYFGILLLEKKREFNDNLQKLLNSNCDMVASCVRNGIAMPADYDAVRVELLAAKNSRVEIEASLGSYIGMLSLFTGIAAGDIMPVMPQCDTAAFNSAFMLSDALLRPEIALINARKKDLSSQTAALKASMRPKLGAFFQGYYGNPGLDMFGDMMHDHWSWNYVTGIRLQWNLGGYYTRRNKLRQIDLNSRSLDAEKRTFLFNSRIKGIAELAEIDKMKKMVERDRSIEKLRTSIRKASESKFENGVISVNDLLKSITDENDARITESLHEITLVKAIYDHKTTIND
ncbi:MAG: TolC family protein [Bacteroidales bacterium]|jgi:outer membrane protein TolC|nr:TolC family protein [Bacteroidales bacterium]